MRTESLTEKGVDGLFTKVAYARAYAALGWPILPLHTVKPDGHCTCNNQKCGHAGKHPRTGHGVKDATDRMEQVLDWWAQWPDANIGLALKPAGLCAIDIDPRNGGTIDAVEARGEIPKTLVQKTGGGGEHILLRCASTLKLPGKLAQGVDLKHDGYVVLEPSTHSSGIRYAFIDWDPLEGEVPAISQAPPWLIATGGHQETTQTTPSGKVIEGGRNAFLSKEAFRLRKMGHNVQQISSVLMALNQSICDPPLPQEEVLLITKGKTKITPGEKILLTDFWAYLPMHQYLHIPTNMLWPAASVNGRIRDWPASPSTQKTIKPSTWLDANRPIVQLTWSPGEPTVIEGRVVADGGWIDEPSSRVFNLYRGPSIAVGNPIAATPWLEHIRLVYPNDWEHVVCWLAHRVQRPGEKINHALVLGGAQGIGKDSILEPVKRAVGAWNWSDITPAQMLGRFNGWAKAVIVRISEARDLGDTDRFKFYDHSKIYIAAPPDVIRVDEKNLREHAILNVMGVIFTTNNRTDGLFLPSDDRRHFVAWSELTRDEFHTAYWEKLYTWYDNGGCGHVAAYLRSFNLSEFDPKAPPPKTPAFHAIVATNQDPDLGVILDLIERLGSPCAFTLDMLQKAAAVSGQSEIYDDLFDRKYRRSIPHKLDRAGYTCVPNPDTSDQLWRVDGSRRVIYCRKSLQPQAQVRAARELQRYQVPLNLKMA